MIEKVHCKHCLTMAWHTCKQTVNVYKTEFIYLFFKFINWHLCIHTLGTFNIQYSVSWHSAWGVLWQQQPETIFWHKIFSFKNIVSCTPQCQNTPRVQFLHLKNTPQSSTCVNLHSTFPCYLWGPFLSCHQRNSTTIIGPTCMYPNLTRWQTITFALNYFLTSLQGTFPLLI